MFKFELGKKAIDTITGLKGIITGRLQYLNGCIRYCLTPKMGKDGKMPEGVWVDENQIQITEGGIKVKQKKVGGPNSCDPKNFNNL